MIAARLQTRAGALEFPLWREGGRPQAPGGGVASAALQALDPQLSFRIGQQLVTPRQLLVGFALTVLAVRYVWR
jgi:hypothetical protein